MEHCQSHARRGKRDIANNVLAVKSAGECQMPVPPAYERPKQVTGPVLNSIRWAYKNLFMGGNPESLC